MIPYVIKVALMLAASLLFYLAVLQKETFYRVNRYVIAGCLVLSFSLPLVPVSGHWLLRPATTFDVPPVPHPFNPNTSVQLPPFRKAGQGDGNIAAASPPFDFSKIMTLLLYVYWFGVIAFGINLMIQVLVLLYRAFKGPRIKEGSYTIIELTGDKAPCSFARYIFINPEKYDWHVYNEILLHEQVHVRGWHSVDILLAELVIVFQWFNPFAWRFRKVVESNIEFLTDEILLTDAKVDKTSYQFNLLKVAVPHLPLGVTMNYNQSLLKQRIVMMNVKKSSFHTSWKYIFLLPNFVCLMLVLNEPPALAKGNAIIPNKWGRDYFTLTGTIEGLEHGTLLLKYIDKYKKEITDTSELSNGHFYFKGPIAVPTLATCINVKAPGIKQLFLEPTDMIAIAENNSFREMKITGSRAQSESDTLQSLCAPILKESEPLEIAYLDANNHHTTAALFSKDQQLLDSLGRLVEQARDKLEPSSAKIALVVYRFIERHPGSYCAAFQFTIYHKRWSPDSTLRLYNSLTVDVQQSVYGKAMKNIIEKTVAVRQP